MRCTAGRFTDKETAVAKGKANKSVDFFISYATSDEAMAKEIGSILDEAGYTYVAQFRDFVAGKNFVREMQRGLAASTRLIALLSPAYEGSDNCQAEWSAAYAQDPGARNGKIIPFKIAEVQLNPLAGPIVYKPLVGLDADQRRAVVLETFAHWVKPRKGTGAAAAARRPSPAGRKPSNLPSTIGQFFKGRDEFLEQLRELFRHNVATAITGTAVHGLGGVGKTRTAIEYGHKFAAEYSATFFLIGKSESDFKDSLAALADATILDLPEKDLPDLDARVAAAIRWLQTNPGWLLIVDNVDDEPAARATQAFLDQVSRSDGHVLVTSRMSAWGNVVEPLELDLLSVDAAKELLRESTSHRTKRADEDAALSRLAEEQLGCLSLALVQAAAYIDERRIGFADYSALFENEATKLLAKLGEAAMRNLGYRRPIALTWQTSIAQLSEAGRLLLDMLAWLSIEPIPRSLFAVWPQAESVDLDEGLTELTRYSFVHWEAENSAITLHRLVAQVTRDNLDATGRDRALGALFSWLKAVNPEMNADDVRCWPQLLPLLPHALSLFKRTEDWGPYSGQTDFYNENATLLQSLARYSEAEPLFRRALAIDETSYGSAHPFVATRLNNLALLLRHTDRLTEAEPLYRRALKISEETCGPEHFQVAEHLNNLAGLLRADHRLTEAEPLLNRALKIDEAAFGSSHWKVAVRLNNLAALLAETNRASEAEPLHRRALAIDEALYGLHHPYVAIDVNNLAWLLADTNRPTEAEPLFRRAALILLSSSKTSGLLLPGTAPALRNYAAILNEADREADDVNAVIASVIIEAGFDPAELWPQVFGEDG